MSPLSFGVQDCSGGLIVGINCTEVVTTSSSSSYVTTTPAPTVSIAMSSTHSEAENPTTNSINSKLMYEIISGAVAVSALVILSVIVIVVIVIVSVKCKRLKHTEKTISTSEIIDLKHSNDID